MAQRAPQVPDQSVAEARGYANSDYVYQIEVSVWLAQDLVLTNRRSPAGMIETTSEEDLEADATVASKRTTLLSKISAKSALLDLQPARYGV